MKFTTNKKMHIIERDNSPAKHCITGEYTQIDPKQLNFAEWKEKALALDPAVDFTYWEFDIKMSKDLKNKYIKSDALFTQEKYIVTNRRMIHIFNNDPHYHASGFHRKPTNIVELLKGLFIPDSVKFSKHRGLSYELKNNKNKIKSFLNIQDDKYLKVQTSYLSEGVNLIEELSYSYSDEIDKFNGYALNESHRLGLRDKYLLMEKFLYTYNPNIPIMKNLTEEHEGILSIQMDEEQLYNVLKNINFITEEVDCHYLIEGYTLTLILKD